MNSPTHPPVKMMVLIYCFSNVAYYKSVIKYHHYLSKSSGDRIYRCTDHIYCNALCEMVAKSYSASRNARLAVFLYFNLWDDDLKTCQCFES